MIFDFNQGFDNNESLIFSQRPLIAISANIIDENSALHFAYTQAIDDSGGVPIIIPANSSAESLNSLMWGVDGLLLSGGADIDALYFGEENMSDLTDVSEQRDTYEFQLLRAAFNSGLPVLGICRGCQLLNVAMGGSLYQDLPTLYPNEVLPHSVITPERALPAHEVMIGEGSLLRRILQCESLGVNSRHHQAIKNVAPQLSAVAHSQDGVVEAVEGYPLRRVIAMQCHPENMATSGNSVQMKRLFSFFVGEAELYRRAKMIHMLNPIVDSHCDTPMLYDEGGFDFAQRNSAAKVDIVKMREGYLDATITVAYIPQRTPPEEATQKALSLLRRFRGDLGSLGSRVVVAESVEELLGAKLRGAKSVMLGVENGLALGDNLDNVDLFKSEGVVYITLCHNGSNAICDSAIGAPIHGGVSEFGRGVIERMNALGVTIDISHSSEQSTWDALQLSAQPIIASHSSCKALCNHPRNLSDEAIKAIAAQGGVVQICGYEGFLVESGVATIFDIIAHIEHVVELVGYDAVGVGSDFDGGGGVEGFDGANDFIGLTVELLRRGHSEGNIAKIMGGNILRVLSENQKR